MKIFLSAPFFGDDSNADEIRAVIRKLESNGYAVFCFMEEVEKWGAVELDPKSIYDRCLAEIKGADCLVAVIGENCPGIAVEVGMARALKKPIYAFAPDGLKRVGAYIGAATEFFRLPDDAQPQFIAQHLPTRPR